MLVEIPSLVYLLKIKYIPKLMCFVDMYLRIWSNAIHGSWMVNHYIHEFWTIPLMSISRSNWRRYPSLVLDVFILKRIIMDHYCVGEIVASGEGLPTLVGAWLIKVVTSDIHPMFPSDVPSGHSFGMFEVTSMVRGFHHFHFLKFVRGQFQATTISLAMSNDQWQGQVGPAVGKALRFTASENLKDAAGTCPPFRCHPFPGLFTLW